jgi:methylated-DNA-protein-cysteine methyltransferase-like protein
VTSRARLPKERPLGRIAAVIESIPRGRVATYGEIAAVAGFLRAPRLVVYALKLSDGTLPWHRVLGRLNATYAHVSIREPGDAALQRRLLVKEGVRFDREGRVDLQKYGWLAEGEPSRKRKKAGEGRRP